MAGTPPTPWVARILEKNGETLYLIVERVNDEDIHGDLVRFRVHRHPPNSARVADASNVAEVDESGNQYQLRLKYVQYLLDRRDEGWKRVGASKFGSTEAQNYWSLENL